MQTFLAVSCTILSILAIILVLMHRGSGEGLTDMFGGNSMYGAAKSAQAPKNLSKALKIVAVLWFATVVAMAIL